MGLNDGCLIIAPRTCITSGRRFTSMVFSSCPSVFVGFRKLVQLGGFNCLARADRQHCFCAGNRAIRMSESSPYNLYLGSIATWARRHPQHLSIRCTCRRQLRRCGQCSDQQQRFLGRVLLFQSRVLHGYFHRPVDSDRDFKVF